MTRLQVALYNYQNVVPALMSCLGAVADVRVGLVAGGDWVR